MSSDPQVADTDFDSLVCEQAKNMPKICHMLHLHHTAWKDHVDYAIPVWRCYSCKWFLFWEKCEE